MCDDRFKALVNAAQENQQSITFISNTEPLHMKKIVTHLKTIMPGLEWEEQIDFQPGVVQKPIKLT